MMILENLRDAMKLVNIAIIQIHVNLVLMVIILNMKVILKMILLVLQEYLMVII